jgi:hypothetical protein
MGSETELAERTGEGFSPVADREPVRHEFVKQPQIPGDFADAYLPEPAERFSDRPHHEEQQLLVGRKLEGVAVCRINRCRDRRNEGGVRL